MVKSIEIKPKSAILSPYIDGYYYFSLSGSSINTKDLLPRPGALVVISNQDICVDKIKWSRSFLVGVHSNLFNLSTEPETTFGFVIKFSPYGLSRFTRIPIYDTINKVIDCKDVFGDKFDHVYQRIFIEPELSKQTSFIEQFLLEQFLPPDDIETYIFKIADYLNSEKQWVDFNELRKNIPLSAHQIERKFKSLIGVNIQTFIRICRFDKAKTTILADQNRHLTGIAYESGYYDQAHFSNEFKVFSKLRPKNFLRFSPFYRFLSNHKLLLIF